MYLCNVVHRPGCVANQVHVTRMWRGPHSFQLFQLIPILHSNHATKSRKTLMHKDEGMTYLTVLTTSTRTASRHTY